MTIFLDIPKLRLTDATVATKCLSHEWWSHKKSGKAILVDRRPREDSLDEEFLEEYFVPSRPNDALSTDWDDYLSYYSQDMAAAWDLVEWIVESWIELTNHPRNEQIFDELLILTYSKDNKWRVLIGDSEIEIGTADTAPLAICEAALSLLNILQKNEQRYSK